MSPLRDQGCLWAPVLHRTQSMVREGSCCARCKISWPRLAVLLMNTDACAGLVVLCGERLVPPAGQQGESSSKALALLAFTPLRPCGAAALGALEIV